MPFTLHPAVAFAAVVAKPDDKWGEVPCAFIELAEGNSINTDADKAALKDKLLQYAATRLAGFQRPKAMVLDTLPKTSTGKILKNELRERAKRL